MGRHHGRQVRTVGDSQRVRHRPDRILTGRRPQSPDKGGKAAISSRHCLRNSLPPQKAGHRTGFRSAPSVPLPRIFSSQALGKITDDPNPKGHQPVHPASALPDGNTGCDPAHVETGRLGRVHRFIGRVPPRSHRPPVSEASRLFVRGQGVPIQSPPLRPKPAPRLFTRLFSAVAALLRGRGIRVFCYLDDWLIVADTPHRLIAHRDLPWG